MNIVLSVLGDDKSGAATKSAMSNIDALTAKRDAASRAFSAMSARDADAIGRVRVATMQLSAAVGKYGDGSLQAVTAQERLASAQRTAQIAANNVTDATSRLGAAQGHLTTALGETEEQTGRVRGAFSALGEGAATAGSHVASLGANLLSGVAGGIAYGLWQQGVQVFDDLGDALENAVKSSIDFDSQLEMASIGFTSMLGSGKAATGMLAELQKFALVTPFRFGDLTQYAQQMLGYGVAAKSIIPDLTALGDAASASGRTDQLGNVVLAFEQISARGRVDLQDINQLTQGGVPALKILAAQYHTTTGGMLDMISTGTLMASDALPKLTAGIEHGTSATAALGGMMTKQSQTFTGAVSNIQDALQQASGKAFAPFFTVLERGAGKVADFLSSASFVKWEKDTARSVGDFVSTVNGGFNAVVNSKGVQDAVKKLGTDLPDNIAKIGPAFKKSLPDLEQFGKDELPKIIDGVDGIVKNTPAALEGLGKFAKAMQQMEPVIDGFIGAVTGIVTFFEDVPGVIADGWNALEQFGYNLGQLGDNIDQGLDDVYATLVGVGYNIGQFGDDVDKGLDAVFDALKNFGYNLAGWWNDDFIGPVKGAIDFMNGLPKDLAVIGGQMIDGLVKGIEGGIGGALGAIGDLAQALPAWVRKILGIASPSKVFYQIGQFLTQGLKNGIQSGTQSDVASAMGSLTDKVKDGYQDVAKASSEAWGKRKTDQDSIAKDTVKAGDLQREKTAAQEALHSAKTAKQREAAKDRLKKIDEEITANAKNQADARSKLASDTTEIKADGTTKQRETREAAILKQIADTNKQLDSLAAARDKVAENLKAAQDKLANAISVRSDFAASVTSSVQALGALTGATATGPATTDWTGTTTTAALSSGDLLGHLQNALSVSQSARSIFQQLKSSGLNNQSYSELVAQFQSNGDLTAASTLLQGGAGAIGQVNTLEGQLTDLGANLGADTSSTLYDQGVNAAQGLVDGLQKADDQLTDQMTKLGGALADAVDKELTAKFTGSKNGGVNVGTINVGGPNSTAEILAALDWASKVQV